MNQQILETDRLILRPWRVSDAADLYTYAKDHRIGPIANWPPHQSVEESAEIIRTVFMQEGVYAVTRKDEDRAIGCVGVIIGSLSNFDISNQEGEISYWIGVPFWGQGYIPEATQRIIQYAFEELGLSALWCGYIDGNEKSQRVQEKCGFTYDHSASIEPNELSEAPRTEHITRLTKEEWMRLKK